MRIDELIKPPELTTARDKLKDVQVDSRDQSWHHDVPSLLQNYGFRQSGRGKYGRIGEGS